MKALAIIAAVAYLPFSAPLAAPAYEGIMCDSDIECEEATGYPYDTGIEPNPPKYPRLVGHGCKGANGPIYAFEEDHFPECREIVSMDWDWKESK